MSTTKKPTGIIYCAENIYSGQKYVGRTIQSLETRILGHYKSSKTSNHKFATALKYYPKEAWKWSVLAEVEIEKLDEYEKFFIADLDTCKNGLNTIPGGSWYGEGSPSYSTKLYTLFHPDHGEVSATRSEWVRRDRTFECITKLVNGKTSHLKGWVMSENKDSYYDKPRLPRREYKAFDFYHPERGVVTCSAKELHENYIGIENAKIESVKKLARGEDIYFRGWVLASNKEIYLELEAKKKTYNEVISLTHPEFGTHTLTRKEFRKLYGLDVNGISRVLNRTNKSHKGWQILEES